jgi:hypothetical protein
MTSETGTISRVVADISIPGGQSADMYQVTEKEIKEFLARTRLINSAQKLQELHPTTQVEDLITFLASSDRSLLDDLIMTSNLGELSPDYKIKIASDNPLFSAGEVAIFGIERFTRDVIVAGNGEEIPGAPGVYRSAFSAKLSTTAWPDQRGIEITVIEDDESTNRLKAASVVIENTRRQYAKRRRR